MHYQKKNNSSKILSGMFTNVSTHVKIYIFHQRSIGHVSISPGVYLTKTSIVSTGRHRTFNLVHVMGCPCCHFSQCEYDSYQCCAKSESSLEELQVKPQLTEVRSRDAPIAIFLGRFRFLIFWKCDLPIPIFTDSDFISKNYHWQHIQTKSLQISMQKYLHNKEIIKHYNSPNLD